MKKFKDNHSYGKGTGLLYYLPPANLGLQLLGRYRHISNAGLDSPNGGIDNFFLVAGVSRIFK